MISFIKIGFHKGLKVEISFYHLPRVNHKNAHKYFFCCGLSSTFMQKTHSVSALVGLLILLFL